MSDYRAVAAVTATLQNMLQPEISRAVEGAVVRAARPERIAVSASPGEVRMFLYQVSPNPSLRNAELPVRRDDGTVVHRPMLALDLHYLFSFYGDEEALVPQLLLGATMGTLHAQPMPRLVDLPARNPRLAGSGLAQQIHLLRFTPLPLVHDELSRLWSIFFQVPYALSVGYLCSAALIESGPEPQPALPTGSGGPRVSVLPDFPPQVEQIRPQVVEAGPSRRITIQGRHLAPGGSRVRLTATTEAGSDVRDVAVDSATPSTVVATLPDDLGPGLVGCQVVRGLGDAGSLASNRVPFSIQPSVIAGPVYAGDPQPTVVVGVAPRVSLLATGAILLHELRSPGDPGSGSSHSLPFDPVAGGAGDGGAGGDGGSAGDGGGGEAAGGGSGGGGDPGWTETVQATVPARVQAGTYLVQVQVEGVASRLAVDDDPDSSTYGFYTSPRVTIPERPEEDP